MFFWTEGLSQTTENLRGQFSASFGAYAYLSTSVDCLAWFKDMVSCIFADNRRKVLPTAMGYSPPSGFLAQLISHHRGTFNVRKVLFLRDSHSQDLLRL